MPHGIALLEQRLVAGLLLPMFWLYAFNRKPIEEETKECVAVLGDGE